ncbi:MAG TPA: nucleotide exchange factor GrpE [Candidatus Binatia bacterium]|jgi:molecular chaperone GrpE
MSDETKNPAESTDTTATNEKNLVEASGLCPEGQTEIDLLREQLKAKEEEAKNNYDRFLRQSADLDNFKKRASRDKEDAVRFANEALVKELLPVVDNLERAVAHAKDGGNGESVVEGVEMILKGLFDALAKHGVVQISAVGQPFNPQLHEAMAQVESPGHEPNTVLAEHQKGYLLKDRLIRPSLVTVVKALKSNEKKNQNRPVENSPTDD